MGTITPAPQVQNWIIEHPGMSQTHSTTEDVLFSQRVLQISDMALNSPRRKRCIVFTTGGNISFMYLAPYPNANPDVFDVSLLFPNSATSVRLTNVPGSIFRLNTDYRIIVSRFTDGSPPNATTARLFSSEWAGNIVVAKYDARGNTEDVSFSDIQLIVSLLGMWLYNIRSLERGLSTAVSP